MSQKQLENAARELGFKSYQEWKLWDAQQAAKRNPAAAKPKVKNVMQNAAPPAKKKKPGHVLDYVADKVTGATRK